MEPFDISSVEIVMLPVPKPFLPMVVKVLAKAMEAVEVDVHAVAKEGLEMNPMAKAMEAVASVSKMPIDWTQTDNLRKLRKGLKSPIAAKLLDMAAAKPGEMIPFDGVYTGTAYPTSLQARSSLGSLTKVIMRDFKVIYQDANWPVEHHWGYNQDSQYYYCMLPDVAKAWLDSAK